MNYRNLDHFAHREGALEPQLLIRMHKSLLLLRHAEQSLALRYKEQEMRTPTHFGLGQEAVAVGVCTALNNDDVVYSHHRCHNHYLAKGGGVFELASELYGRETGCSRGRGGSVHLTDIERGFIGSSAILGETGALAVGSALAFAMNGERRVAVAFFGEAVCEEGILYESLNYAAIRRLPVIFICENNLYSTESPLPVRQPENTDLCERARSFKVKAVRVDGNDVCSVFEAAKHAVDACRNGEGPYFLECMTYRWLEHVGPFYDYELGRTYRTRDELEQWKTRCPVRISGERLTRLAIRSAEELEEWSAEIQREVDKAIECARQAPRPAASALFDNAV